MDSKRYTAKQKLLRQYHKNLENLEQLIAREGGYLYASISIQNQYDYIKENIDRLEKEIKNTQIDKLVYENNPPIRNQSILPIISLFSLLACFAIVVMTPFFIFNTNNSAITAATAGTRSLYNAISLDKTTEAQLTILDIPEGSENSLNVQVIATPEVEIERQKLRLTQISAQGAIVAAQGTVAVAQSTLAIAQMQATITVATAQALTRGIQPSSASDH